ncbi:hypothetical protein MNB_SV-13-310 [hydrothermal vent metagenome]|uniref:Uncharacterized protein n=1 Tax=hydrothermal vent metagenome TaxID=652676 RepID=A0A1W1CYZ8_9ZZZZ
MCKNDVNKSVRLKDILDNEKVMKAIKSEFASGLRNLILSQKEAGEIAIQTQKEIYECTVTKNDFADLLELAEEDAKKHKRIKKDCDGIELVNITTID